MTREEFIKSGVRVFFLALMLGGAGLLAWKRRVSFFGSCDDSTRCASCRIKTSCRDPRKQIPVNDGKQST
ncbi:MAG TPA: hypothetical protein ENI20_06175 [Bacteroides sp.]|nr:hypothetical protein [Bacteroides sp.]